MTNARMPNSEKERREECSRCVTVGIVAGGLVTALAMLLIGANFDRSERVRTDCSFLDAGNERILRCE